MTEFKTKIGNPLLLGATKLFGGANFALIVENEEACPVLRIYGKGTYDVVCDIPFDEKMRFGNVFAMEVKDFDENAYDYGYLCDGRPYPDMYGKIINHREIWGESKLPTYSVFYDDFVWNESSRREISFDEAIIYRMHVRGFTAHKSSGTKYKGTFKGIVGKLPYLKELGINVIELMPAYEFDEIKSVFVDAEEDKNTEQYIENRFGDPIKDSERINYWGYGMASYFAPKSSFAAQPDNVHNEFKEMVQAIHNAGMEIMMEFHFADGMKPNMIMDCIRYWVMEYHIDGVHMNLNAVPVNMIKTDPLLARIKIFGDRWELVNDYYMPMKGIKHLGICNDGFMCTVRRFIKGDEGLTYEVSSKLKENPKDAGIVNYLSTHNSFTLMDSVSYDRKHNEPNGEGNRDGSNLNYSWNCGFEGNTRKKKVVELRKKQIRNALAMLFMSQGTPLIMAGDEMGRTCGGNNNPYCQDNDSNYVNWNDLKKNKDIYEFTRFMINFRREHKILHMESEPRMMDYLSKGCPDLSIHGTEPWRPDFNYVSRCFGMMYNEAYTKEKKGKMYIMFNMYWEPQDFNIPANEPKMKWKLLFTTAEKEKVEDVVGRVFRVPPRAIAVLCEVKN